MLPSVERFGCVKSGKVCSLLPAGLLCEEYIYTRVPCPPLIQANQTNSIGAPSVQTDRDGKPRRRRSHHQPAPSPERCKEPGSRKIIHDKECIVGLLRRGRVPLRIGAGKFSIHRFAVPISCIFPRHASRNHQDARSPTTAIAQPSWFSLAPRFKREVEDDLGTVDLAMYGRD